MDTLFAFNTRVCNLLKLLVIFAIDGLSFTNASFFSENPSLFPFQEKFACCAQSGDRRYFYDQGNEQTTGGAVRAAARPWLFP